MHKLIIRFTILFLFVSLHINSFSQDMVFGKIYVDITNIRSEKGDVKISLFDKADPFPGDHEQAVARTITDIKGTSAIAMFEDISYGEYAIAIMHDENKNLIMDTNWIGIPKEGFGASNDATGKMGPPKYEDAKFRLNKAELRIQIKMSYF